MADKKKPDRRKLKAMFDARCARCEKEHREHEAELRKLFDTHAKARQSLHDRHQEARRKMHAEYLDAIGSHGEPLYSNPRSPK